MIGRMARTVGRLEHAAVDGLAVLACVIVAVLFFVILYDVLVRTAGFPSPLWPSVVAEFGLLYFAMAVAPYLVRVRGHVFVGTIVCAMPPVFRAFFERVIYTICVLVCGLVAYLSAEIWWDNYIRGAIDMRTIPVAMWVQYLPLPFGFGLMGIEFSRFLFGKRSMYGEPPAARD